MSGIKEKIKNTLMRLQDITHVDVFYIASSGFWTSAGFGITSIFSFLLVLAFANFLPKETYGTYKYIMSLSGALAFFTLTGMNTAVTQAVARGHDHIINYALRVQLKWNLLFLAASAILSGYYLAKDNHILALSISILGIAFPFITALNTYGAFLIGKKKFKEISILSTASGIIYSLSMILAVFLSGDVVVLVIAYSLANLLPLAYFYSHVIKKYKPSGSDPEEEKKLFNYGAHLSFVNIFSNLSQYVDKIVVFHFLGAIELAVYGLALAIPERVRGFTKSVTGIILPKLSEKNINDIRPVFYKRTMQAMGLGAIISLGYILLAPFVFKTFLPRYLESIKYSQVISLYFILNLPASYMGEVFSSQKMIKTIYLSSIAAHVSKITLYIVFGYLWGIWGVIYATLLVSSAGLFYNFILWKMEVKRHLNLAAPGNINEQSLPE